MFVQFTLALLAFSCLTAASDPGCDDLLRPLEDRSKIFGKWIFYTGTSDSEEDLKALQLSTSSWVDISPIPDSEEFSILHVDKMGGKCVCWTINSTTSGNNITFTLPYNSTNYVIVGRYLETCPDCVLWTDEMVSEVNGVTKKSKNLYLSSKTGKVDASHLEVFKKQAKCLNLLMDFYFPDTTGLCPVEKESATDAPTAAQ